MKIKKSHSQGGKKYSVTIDVDKHIIIDKAYVAKFKEVKVPSKKETIELKTSMQQMLQLLTEHITEFKEFKADMIEFKTDMIEFKTDMLEFKTDMLEFKNNQIIFNKNITEDIKEIKQDIRLMKNTPTMKRELKI